MKMLKKLFLLLALILGLGLVAAPAYATLIEPVLYSGNPTCDDIEGCAGFGFNIDPVADGAYIDSAGGLTVLIDEYTNTGIGQEFNWSLPSGTVDLCAIIVKGGNAANVYFYDDPVSGDTGLHAPANASGKWADLSHIDFCYNSVPEPATMLLLGTALIALGLWGWGRKRSKAKS